MKRFVLVVAVLITMFVSVATVVDARTCHHVCDGSGHCRNVCY